MVIKETTGDKVFNIVNVTLLTMLLLIVLYPLYFVVIASFSDPMAVNLGQVVWYPKGVRFLGYSMAYNYPDIWIGYRNTIVYASLGTLVHLCVNLPAAYALSRRDFKGAGMITVFFMVPMFFGGGLIPWYLLIINTLNWGNTVWAMIIPGATGFYSLLVARTFFRSTIPDELRESAEIDGASNVRVFLSIVLPLSTAIIAVQGLFSAVGHWNAFFNAFLFISGREGASRRPLQLVLREILILAQAQLVDRESIVDPGDAQELMDRMLQLRYAVIIVSVLPILIVYPFVQRYFVKGVMIGAIKG